MAGKGRTPAGRVPDDPADLTRLARHVLVASSDPADDDRRGALDALLSAIIDGKTLHPPIRRFLFGEDDVANAEQQALVAISFNLDSWSQEGEIAPWLRQIAANEAKMIIRARERRRKYEDAAANATTDFVERLSSHLATQADLERGIAQLTTDLAAALELRRAGFGYGEIAAKLGIPEGTAKTRVRAARNALADLLARGTSP